MPRKRKKRSKLTDPLLPIHKQDADQHGVAYKDYRKLRVLMQTIRESKRQQMLEVADIGLHHRSVKALIEKYKALIQRILKITQLEYFSGQYSRGSGQAFQLSGYGYGGYTPAWIGWKVKKNA